MLTLFRNHPHLKSMQNVWNVLQSYKPKTGKRTFYLKSTTFANKNNHLSNKVMAESCNSCKTYEVDDQQA